MNIFNTETDKELFNLVKGMIDSGKCRIFKSNVKNHGFSTEVKFELVPERNNDYVG